MPTVLSFTPVTDLVAALVAAGVSASVNPEDITLPGAWVTVDAIAVLTFGGDVELECAVYLIAGDTDYLRAYTQLEELFTQAATVLYPDGPVIPQGVVMPGSSTPMPALRFQVNLI